MQQMPVAIFTVAVVLFGVAGCRGARSETTLKSTLRDQVNPLPVVGTISPRSGFRVPSETRIEVVVCRRDYPDTVVAIHPLTAARTWPASFEFPVNWPNVPARGEEVTWKFGPPVLSVYARGLTGNQQTLISESKDYAVKDAIRGRAVELVLVPTRE